MFLCEKCNRQTQPGEKMHKEVIKTRPRYYPNGSVGWEIVKEINVCSECSGDKK